MHICFVSVEIFAWGKYGGFGKATRLLGRELVKRGHQVSAIIPRRGTQQRIEQLDGITVYGYDIRKPFETLSIIKECEADLYHSQEPNLVSYLVQRFHPEKKHVVTFRDTRLLADWLTEFKFPSKNRVQVILNMVFEDNLFVHHAVRNADARFAASHLLIDRAQRKYRLNEKPRFLPTPVDLPGSDEKSEMPTVCFISRWDRRKRPELLIQLAAAFPAVRFIAVGASRDAKYDQQIRLQLTSLPNTEVHEMVNQFESNELSSILSCSWILLNTAAREGLPNAFIEACGHGCAILSSVDPDGFTSKFGCRVEHDDYSSGLKFLLEENRWAAKGASGAEYVRKTFRSEIAIDQHLIIYHSLLEGDTLQEQVH